MAETLPAARPADERLRLLDGLRLLAALAVLVFHFTAREHHAWGEPTDEAFPWLHQFTLYGALGVQFFFMISGFVVLMSTWGRSLPQFAASRIARLYPAYWFAVLSVIALRLATHPEVSLADAAVNLTMVQDAFGAPNVIGVSWTLFVELKFYLLLGILGLLGITRQRVLAFCALWPLVGAIAQSTGSGLLESLLVPSFAPFFAIGMLLYLVYREGWTAPTALLLGLNWLLTLFLAQSWALPFLERHAEPGQWWVVALACTAMIGLILLATRTRLARLRWRWLTVAGAITYPLYLLHEAWGRHLILLLHEHVPKYVLLVGVSLLMIAVAYLVHRFVERPLGPPLRRALERGFSPAAGRGSDARDG